MSPDKTKSQFQKPNLRAETKHCNETFNYQSEYQCYKDIIMVEVVEDPNT